MRSTRDEVPRCKVAPLSQDLRYGAGPSEDRPFPGRNFKINHKAQVMENYAELMFTPAVAAEQENEGTRALYAAQYQRRTKSGLGPEERSFLESRTTLYMATVSETGWPYVQHRGGPQGFLKVLDHETLGFADYRGNRQLISKGNLTRDDRISLFAMDYPRRARLKLQGYATMQAAGDAPDLVSRLATEGEGRVERVVTIRIVAFDWNCPQYITPRFDEAEVNALAAPLLARRDRAIARLSERLKALGEDPAPHLEDPKDD
ncbi:MAG: pyridoxamine 5'-phosphate oxidase family protein [Pseudomonadota bacterium]